MRIAQSDSSAALTDRRADSLAEGREHRQAGGIRQCGARARAQIGHAVAVESDPLTWDGRYVPSASAWAFGGAKVGETSDLIDADDAYYLARLDSLQEGGKPNFEAARDDIRRELLRTKKLEMLIPKAQQLVAAVRGGKSLEAAAQAAGLKVEKSPMLRAHARRCPALGQTTEAIGAAFGAPVGSVAPPVKGQNDVIVLRVDKRTESADQRRVREAEEAAA